MTSRDEFVGKGEVRLDVSSTSDCHDEDAMFPGRELGKGLKVEAEVFERCVETILGRSIGRKRKRGRRGCGPSLMLLKSMLERGGSFSKCRTM